MEINKELLLKVKNKILAEPKVLDMSVWIGTHEGGAYDVDDIGYIITDCTTPACIAGHAVIEGGELLLSAFSAPTLAQELLGLDSNQANRLFFTDQWPSEFKEAWDLADAWHHDMDCNDADEEAVRTKAKRAIIAARRIDHFIETEGF